MREDERMGIRVSGATVRCGGCGAVVYPNAWVLANHDITTRPDGRVQWWSRDFEATVHLCELPAAERAVEQASGLILTLLADLGMAPAR